VPGGRRKGGRSEQSRVGKRHADKRLINEIEKAEKNVARELVSELAAGCSKLSSEAGKKACSSRKLGRGKRKIVLSHLLLASFWKNLARPSKESNGKLPWRRGVKCTTPFSGDKSDVRNVFKDKEC